MLNSVSRKLTAHDRDISGLPYACSEAIRLLSVGLPGGKADAARAATVRNTPRPGPAGIQSALALAIPAKLAAKF